MLRVFDTASVVRLHSHSYVVVWPGYGSGYVVCIVRPICQHGTFVLYKPSPDLSAIAYWLATSLLSITAFRH
jgi:hypothetical protein